MYHRHLERQMRKFLGEELSADVRLQGFLRAVSDMYEFNERDRELSEHAFQVNEAEYELVNNRLLQLTAELENKVQERTREIRSAARFPLESPNPNLRISSTGEIIYMNPAAEKLKNFLYQGKTYAAAEFFRLIIKEIEKNGSLEVDCGEESFLFHYSSSPGHDDINFYGSNVTERNSLRKKAYDNFYRLSNFLETTDDAYYVVYSKYTDKSFVTSKWGHIYGFNPGVTKDIIKERAKLVREDFKNEYENAFRNLTLGDRITLHYCVVNAVTGEEFWLQELVSKQFDAITGDLIISGRITDVTRQHLYSMQLKESEERFKLIMDQAPVMVWVSNEFDMVEYSNMAANSMLAKPFSAMKDQKEFASYVHPEDRHIAVDHWNRQLAKRKVSELEYRILDKEGHYRNVYQKAVPRYYSDGKFAGYIGVFFDLTNEKMYQHSLFEEKQKLELLSQNSPDTVILMDRKGIIEYISPSVTRNLGYKPEELVGRSLFSITEKRSPGISQLRTYIGSGKRSGLRMEYRMLSKTGQPVWVESALSVIREKGQRSAKILLHNRDIHSVKLAEEALKESEEKFRTLFENMQLGVMEVDLKERIVWVNKTFEAMSGYTLKSLKGKVASDLFLDEAMKDKMKAVNQSRVQKKDSLYEVSFRHRSGKFKEVVISGSALLDREGKAKGSVGIHWDISEVRETQRKLEEERISKQHEIIQASLAAEERQKEILGRDLHDGVGQMLTYTSLYLQMAANAEKYDPNAFVAARNKILNILQEVRRISRSLVPPALTDLGLKEALIELLNQYSDMKFIDFDLKFNIKQPEQLDFNAQTTLYRVIQEMTNNTLKYADATKVNIVLSSTASTLVLKYRDNGRGFNMEKIKLGVGLKSIRSRVEFYKGSVSLNSRPNEGVQYLIEIPLQTMIKKGV